MNLIYSTNRLVVAFSCTSDKINCTVYRKGVRTDNLHQLQSCTIDRKGFKQLIPKLQLAACRSVLKAIRNRMSQALRVTLSTKG